MRLFYRETGEGEPLVILHGLYGSSDNWMTIARKLGEHYHVILPDQRNHGQSPHSRRHDYPAMAADLEELACRLHLDRFILMGHSMGGKTAMFFALRHPQRISALIPLDISPRTYRISSDNGTSFALHKKIMEAMLRLDLAALHSRDEVTEALARNIPPLKIRQFLLKNLTRDDRHRFRWKINLPALYDNLEKILEGPDRDPELRERRFTGAPVLFIRGGASAYLPDDDLPLIHRFFPQARIHTLAGAGHWLHAEQPEPFIRTVTEFLLPRRHPS